MLSKLNNDILKRVIIVFIVIFILFGVYNQINLANNTIQGKVGSFYNLKPAGEWIKQNSERGDIVLSAAVPQLTYYSEREIMSFDNNQSRAFKDVKEYSEELDKRKPKYVIWTIWERSPEWFNNLIFANPQNPGGLNITLVNALFINGDQRNVDVLVYRTNY